MNNSKHHKNHEWNHTINLIWWILFKLYLYLDIKFEWTQTLHHPTEVNRYYTFWIGLKASLFSVWFYIKQLQSMMTRITFLLSQQDIGRVLYTIWYRENPARKAGVIVPTPLKFYYTGPVATLVWMNMQHFRNFSPLYLFSSSSNHFLNKFRIRTRSIHDHVT